MTFKACVCCESEWMSECKWHLCSKANRHQCKQAQSTPLYTSCTHTAHVISFFIIYLFNFARAVIKFVLLSALIHSCAIIILSVQFSSQSNMGGLWRERSKNESASKLDHEKNDSNVFSFHVKKCRFAKEAKTYLVCQFVFFYQLVYQTI